MDFLLLLFKKNSFEGGCPLLWYVGVGVKREGAEGEKMKEERMIDERTSGSFETPRG